MSKNKKDTNLAISGGSPLTLGATADESGVNFAVFSEHASAIELCFFSHNGRSEHTRLVLPEKTGPVWHGYIENLRPGARYGYRAHGNYLPEQGHRFNPNKLLLDPYARELDGVWIDDDAAFGYDPKSPELDYSFSTVDSAPFVPKAVVSDPAMFPKLPLRDSTLRTDELIYEAHVKGLTKLHPGVAEAVRGTYDGLASEAIIDHLLALNVTTVELLPVQAFIDDSFLTERKLVNYWGYNSIGFFTPEPRYFGELGLLGFRAMVQKFQAAGIKVILDVVYNHTAEGDHRGPTLSFRGLDNASYYRLIAGQPRYYVNDTGCGNTLNVSHPFVLRMVLDSLRFWVECMGVDGFRFDLATTLGREEHGFDPSGGFFDALRQDPVLSRVSLIAEPWDIGPGGYRLGEFPHEFAEWNDAYRDTVRRYWRGDSHSAQELGARLLASADSFDRAGRPATSSINFLCSHDGFTLADVTRYNERHNEKNTEDNRDGHNANFSDNCGVEGDTDDTDIIANRSRRQYNLLATLFLSQGTPMLLAGDEIGNSQQGNNNAYCQDNEIGWIDWQDADKPLLTFVRKLSQFRKNHSVLRQNRFLHGENRKGDDLPDVAWTDFAGRRIQWRDPGLSSFCLTIRSSADSPRFAIDGNTVFMVFNRDESVAEVTLPHDPSMALSNAGVWTRHIDTAKPHADPTDEAGSIIKVRGHSVAALVHSSIKT